VVWRWRVWLRASFTVRGERRNAAEGAASQALPEGWNAGAHLPTTDVARCLGGGPAQGALAGLETRAAVHLCRERSPTTWCPGPAAAQKEGHCSGCRGGYVPAPKERASRRVC